MRFFHGSMGTCGDIMTGLLSNTGDYFGGASDNLSKKCTIFYKVYNCLNMTSCNFGLLRVYLNIFLFYPYMISIP
jgi:hypothetical protein